MAADDLNAAFFKSAKPSPARRRRPPIATAVATTGLIVGIVALLWVAVVDDPDGGRPVAVAVIANGPASTGSLTAANSPSADGAGTAVERPLHDGVELAALPPVAAPSSADPSLVEQSPFGLLPRISADGRRPRDVYARRAPQAAAGAPRIAIIVGGMGLSQTGTQRAIEALPEDVTLAFAPYGSSLQRWVDKARGEGHEILMQIPLEPLGYPESNPGDHTLLVATDRRSNERDLNWALGRSTSYAGILNYMGARFTAEDKALAHFLGEIGRRGLFYVEDGSLPASRSAVVGPTLQTPVVVASAVLDRVRSVGDITRELRALEAAARGGSVAVGVASAFPASIEAITMWADAAEARGIVLVPASAAIKSSR